jgi:hypothetical protein
MSISTNTNSASTRSGTTRRRTGRKCPRCKRFGTFGPNSIVCDLCLGVLPLIFDITVTVTVGGEQ